MRSKGSHGVFAPSALRYPKRTSRCSLARSFRPLRVLRLAASATGGARLRTPCPLPRCGGGAVWASNCLFYPQSWQRDFLRLACRNQIKNQPYKRRRVGRNLRLSRADPALCSGQPSPLRCILLSPQGLTTLRGPRLYGVYRRVGVSGSSPSDFWVLFFIEKYPPAGRRTNEYLL